MSELNLFDLISKRVLVTRSSARSIESHLMDAIIEGDGAAVLDLSGIEGITPSFLDETISVLEEGITKLEVKRFRVTPSTNTAIIEVPRSRQRTRLDDT